MKSFVLFLGAFSILFCSSSVFGENLFSVCRFHFGTDNGKAQNDATLMTQVDYLTAWAGNGENFDMSGFFTTCKNNNKTPVIISYIIAFTARRDKGLQDCNVATPDLCHEGANYLRQNKARIMGQYQKYAKGAAQSFGAAQPMVWCMEPDYSQYSESTQSGGGLSVADCGSYMNEFLDTIRAYCPNAVFSMDISPWKDTTWQKSWFAAMKISRFTFVNTSGGMSRPDQVYIGDNWSTALPRWGWVFKTFGTPLLADADYGTAGGSTGYDVRWNDVGNLTARINDGVIGISHYNPASSYAADISGLRSKIPAPPKCPAGGSATLPFTAPTGDAAAGAMPTGGTMELIDLSGRVLFGQQLSAVTGTCFTSPGDAKQVRPGAYFIRMRGKSGTVQKRLFITN